MAKRRKKKKGSGLYAFLIVLAVAIVGALALFLAGTVRSGRLSPTTRNAGNSAAAGTAETESVVTGDATPVKDGDMISGTIYDPETGVNRKAVDEYGNANDVTDLTPVTSMREIPSETADEGTLEAAPETVTPTEAPAESTPQEAAPAAESTSSDPNTVYVTDSSVNIRSGPGTDSEVLGKAGFGDSLTKTGESGDWTEISYNGQTAYIKSEFVSSEKPQTPTWDLYDLDNEAVNFGYSNANRDENNVPTDWEWYENKWGQFDVDWIQDTSKNTIYLTMDEGFGNDNTITILDTLKEKNVNVLFFLTKNFYDDRPELIQRMLDEGHQLGNHTCTHPKMPTLSIEEQTDQIMTLHNLVKDTFGYEMKAFRYPEGVYSNQSLGLVNNLGYKVVFWSYAYGDYDEANQPPVDESLEKALNALHPGAIYLLHASSDTNTAMLADFIDGARERGFEFGRYPLE